MSKSTSTDLSPTLAEFFRQILALELLWPLPLLALGIVKIVDPVAVSIAVVLAFLPRLTFWLVMGRFSRRLFIGGPLALLVVSGFIGVWASYDPALSWPLLLTLLGSVALFVAIIHTATPTQYLEGGLVLIAALGALYFVGQYGHFNYLEEVGQLADLGRATGSLLPNLVFFTPHPNAIAGFLEGTLLLALVLAWQTDGPLRFLWLVAAALIAYGLLISGSRGAWLGLAVAGGLWFWLLIPNRTLRLSLAGAAILTIGIGGYGAAQLLVNPPANPTLNSLAQTAVSRLTLYRNSLYLWGDYPFTGIGPGDTFAPVYSHYQLLIPYNFLSYSHNLFLSVALGLGLLGLAAFFWLLINFYAFVIKVEQGDLRQRYRYLFRAVWLGVTVNLVHGLTDSPQWAGSGWPMPLFFALMGLTIVSGRLVLPRSPEHPIRLTGLIAALIAVVILLSGLMIFWRPILGAWYANMGALEQTRAELAPGLSQPAREQITLQAVDTFARALGVESTQRVANRRLGLLALNRDNFEIAVLYLEKAYPYEPHNQATLKALGLAYLWTGRLDEAEPLLQQLDNQGGLVEELGYWATWRGSQGQTELSAYTAEMIQRLRAMP